MVLERMGNVPNSTVLSVFATFVPSGFSSVPTWLPFNCLANRSFALYRPIVQARTAEKKPSSTKISGILIAVGAVAGLFLLTALVLVLFCVWRQKRRAHSPSLKEIDPTNISIQVLKAN